MKNHLQTAMKLAARAALGVALAMLWLAPGDTRAKARHVAHPKKHAVHAKKTVAHPSKKAGVERVSYGYKKAAVRRRHVRRRRVWRRHHVTLPKRPSRDRTEEIQTALARGGYYTGEPNGKWDSRMSGALERFQAANGITPTGKLDALSLQKMGLGSSVAGVSAPRAAGPANPAGPSPSAGASVPKNPGT